MMAAYQKLVPSLLKHRDGSNSVEYALIMTLVAISIIAGVISVSTNLGGFFNSMGTCLNDTPNCSAATFSNGGDDDDDDNNT